MVGGNGACCGRGCLLLQLEKQIEKGIMVPAIGSLVRQFPSASSHYHYCKYATSSRLPSLGLGRNFNLAMMRRLLSSSRCNDRVHRFRISNLPTVRRLLSSSRCNNSLKQTEELVWVCTNPEAVDVVELSALLAVTGQNCEQFPTLFNDGTTVPVNPTKLACALRHSTVVVALYVESCETPEDTTERLSEQVDGQRVRGWLDYWVPRPPGKKTLIAFGRATSDHTLTASIYDLVVAPSYQRSGYGTQVLQRIISDLRLRGICDIAVTPLPELRPFFHHCGFAPDALKSVTMMYTRTPFSTTDSLQIKEFGRRSLLIPPPLTVSQCVISHQPC